MNNMFFEQDFTGTSNEKGRVQLRLQFSFFTFQRKKLDHLDYWITTGLSPKTAYLL